jgi:putative tryptophan/tyrosine transport system substrate-binding protein
MAIHIGRRELIAALGGVMVAWPLTTRAQQSNDRVRRIGVLMNMREDDPDVERRLTAFRDALDKLGWTEGRNAIIDARLRGGGVANLHSAISELLGVHPDLILATATNVLTALRLMAHDIPIVLILWGRGSSIVWLIQAAGLPDSQASSFRWRESGSKR